MGIFQFQIIDAHLSKYLSLHADEKIENVPSVTPVVTYISPLRANHNFHFINKQASLAAIQSLWDITCSSEILKYMLTISIHNWEILNLFISPFVIPHTQTHTYTHL